MPNAHLPPRLAPRRRDDGPEVDAATIALARRFGHMRSALVCYVRARRGVEAPLPRVLAEVRDLVDAAVASEVWPDPEGALAAQAARWALEAYYDVCSALSDGRSDGANRATDHAYDPRTLPRVPSFVS